MGKKKKTVKTESVEEPVPEVVDEPIEPNEPESNLVVSVKSDAVLEEPKKSLDERLLEYYRNAKVGEVTLSGLIRDLDATPQQLGHAWDNLYNAGLIEFGKFVKSCETYP